jgi:hypothetical protein
MKENFSRFLIKWKAFANRAMVLQAKIILWVLYFTILAPIAFWYKKNHDVLKQKKVKSNWQNWEHTAVLDNMHKM